MRDEILKEKCRKILKRIAWRLQYAVKKKGHRETYLVDEIHGDDITSCTISQLYVEEVLLQIPEKARFIIYSIVIDGMTEEEVAQKLNVTRQGVNKCKNKYLRVLAEKILPFI
ncbi:sigma-70 family RNA polymerase sigma factor [Brevibacillus ruminantium]|uniref:Sigma-70 family RNA polymerase sigma factor n=1 Tax=Brevibacillus ruminantium TaxID=2950604 RepID=A0ABY4WGE6_9BACL|nr:sigma factor-like helix-turn-helix DNA-binding protein [Brevibacillus ruminantium]USG65102.1 sigma-70 family RNA polymerase sigma factor [Brevibacillus ruminantium]